VIDQQSLERAAERFVPPEGSFERLALRRDRRRRDRRIRAGVLGIAVAIAVGWLGVDAFRSTPPLPTDDPMPAPAPASPGALAYVLDGDVYVAESDGSDPVRIADGRPPGDCQGMPEYWAEGSIWSPDGRYLAYRHADCEGDGGWRWNVVISDAEGNVVASFPGDGWEIAWSPDSTRVAVWDRLFESIGVYGLDGERRAALTVPSGWEGSGDHDPIWAPDGASLLVRRAVIPLDGSPPRTVPREDWRYEGAFSPDRSLVAYGGRRSLIVAAADGSDAHEVFGDWTSSETWSARGDMLAFVSWVSTPFESDSQLRVLDVATGTVSLLTQFDEPSSIEVIGFSPEGDRILLSNRVDDGSDAGLTSLYVIDADGSDLRRLVTGAGWGDWHAPSATP
jgi:Tol biopolymer transport system component